MATDVENLGRRLVALEERAIAAEDLLDELNRTIYRQQQQIESLARELVALRDRHISGNESPGGFLPDERPPHY